MGMTKKNRLCVGLGIMLVLSPVITGCQTEEIQPSIGKLVHCSSKAHSGSGFYYRVDKKRLTSLSVEIREDQGSLEKLSQETNQPLERVFQEIKNQHENVYDQYSKTADPQYFYAKVQVDPEKYEIVSTYTYKLDSPELIRKYRKEKDFRDWLDLWGVGKAYDKKSKTFTQPKLKRSRLYTQYEDLKCQPMTEGD